MKKYEIVKEHKDFDSVIHEGKCIYNKYCLIYNKDSNFDYPRFGVAVGKKIGNAVTRNKIKRQLRMILTTNKNLFKKNKDYIIIVKRSVLSIDYHSLEKSIIDLIEK
jgi:ribonuclease P protein component